METQDINKMKNLFEAVRDLPCIMFKAVTESEKYAEIHQKIATEAQCFVDRYNASLTKFNSSEGAFRS